VSRLPLQLDVILPTHNRPHLLSRALDSLLAAEVPADLRVRIVVVDNNSTEAIRELVRARIPDFNGRLTYLFEPRPGKPYALNTGIAATDGDLVGLIDDDEEIDAEWYRSIATAFRDDTLDFIGGRCVPRWGAERPAWVGPRYAAVIGWVDNGLEARDFGPSFEGILTGGNAVIRRAVLQKVGPYSTALSRTPTRLMGAEDEHMYRQLLAIGARGRYLPDLIIYHYVPAERLTKHYYRRWSFWCGVSRALIDVDYPAPVPYLGGVPRFLVGKAARDGFRALHALVTRQAAPDERFAAELNVWDLTGFVYGKHVYSTVLRRRRRGAFAPREVQRGSA